MLFRKGGIFYLDDWRPISLLNIDYKIAARVLSKRLQRVVSSIISTDQRGFIKKRSASENIRLVQDVIDYLKTSNSSGIICFLDFKKAFDNVSHLFLFYVLRKFNFKESFITCIKTFYTDAIGRVMNNGWISKKLLIERGARQGCPLLALLFNKVVEILACKIRQHKKIKGIHIFSVDLGIDSLKITNMQMTRHYLWNILINDITTYTT